MVGMDGADLRGVPTGPGEPSPIGGEKILLGELRRGSKEEIERIWANGVAAANAITENRFDYKAHDPSYEAGTDGGQIQNSNSVAYTISKAMGWRLTPIASCGRRMRTAASQAGIATCLIRSTSVTPWRPRSFR